MMDNPGTYSLTQNGTANPPSTDLAITGPNVAPGVICNEISNLDGMLAASIEVRLQYGSGGTTIDHYVQTSLDQGSTWLDVAQAHFTTASATKVFNLSALTPVTPPVSPGDGTLAANTAQDGVIGPRWRTKTVVAGTYAGTTLSTRLNAR